MIADRLANLATRAVAALPPPLRLAAFNAARGVARRVHPGYRKSAARFRAIAGPGHAVRSGPFAGMRYVSSAAGSALAPKLLGTYELELAPAIERLCVLQPDLVVDIGTAEGYYAVGMAVRNPAARIVGYDTNPFARYLAARMARKNAVAARVDLRGQCKPAELDSVLAPAARPVVICDVDGAERDVLNPAQTPALARARLIVELHDHLVPGLSDLIRARFAATHDIDTIRSRPRTPADLPPDVPLSPEDAVAAMAERDVEQLFFVMTPRGATR